MKALTSFVAAAVLAGSVVGRPHVLKRAIFTEVAFVTVASDVVVYIDNAGVPWSTASLAPVTLVGTGGSTTSIVAPQPTSNSIPPTSTAIVAVSVVPSVPFKEAQPSAPPSSTQKPVEPNPTPNPQPPAPPAPPTSVVPSPPSSAPASTPTAKPQGSDGSFPLGITWDPFKPGGCKTEAEWDSQWAKMAEQYKLVRIYGIGCENVPNAIKRAKKHGLKLMVGAYVPDETVDDFVKVLSQAIKDLNNGSWDIISIISIGNERINEHQMTTSQAVDHVNNARGQFRSRGFNGPVGIVDTVPAVVDNPALCDQSDLVLVNIHAYWDANAKPEDAGSFVQGQVQKVKNACKGKRVIVTESGWPRSDGKSGSKASADAQKAAVKSLRDKFSQDLFLFTAFDTLWRNEEYEKYWGILQ